MPNLKTVFGIMTMPRVKKEIDLGKYPSEERKKFDALISALSINDFAEIDAISGPFSPIVEKQFQDYLNDLEEIEKQKSDIEPSPSVNDGTGKFMIEMFRYYLSSSSPETSSVQIIASSTQSYRTLKKK